jgi:DNA primase
VNIVDLVGEHVSLTRRGRTFKGLCPFHDDHNPSLNVDPERQFYKCFSCGAGGDIFDFVMNREKVNFREALESLVERARITLPKTAQRRSDSPRDGLFEIMKWAEDEFHRCLILAEVAAPAREYLAQRGLNESSIKAFRLGFAPKEWDWLIQHARAKRYTPEQLEKCGLARRRSQGSGYYDYFFHGRVMFPIRDAREKTIAFGGRVLPQFASDDTGKYINSPETAIYVKGDHLFGLDRARDSIIKAKTAVVMEGYTDCIMAHQHGVTNVVATLGTALGGSHVAILKRYADRIILVFDGDDAGQKAADRVLGLFLSNEVDLRILSLPDKLDPDEFLQERGAEEFRGQLDSAEEALDFKLRRAGQLFDLGAMHGRRQALDFVLTDIAALPVVTTGTAPVTREIVLDRLGQRLGIPAETVRKRLRERREQQGRRNGNQAKREDRQADTSRPEPQDERLERLERELLETLLAQPELIAGAVEQIKLEEITTPEFRRILDVCIEVIRDGQTVDLDVLRQRLDDRELACRASSLAETGREKGAFGRRLADVLAKFQSRRSQSDDPSQDATRGDGRDSNDARERLMKRFHRKKLSDQRKAQRHAMSDSP